MAMVSLSSYLDGPMGGFHRDIPCKLVLPMKGKYSKIAEEELSSLSENPTLGEFNDKVPCMSQSFEWVFREGFLTLGNIYEVNGWPQWLNIVQLDVREWLRGLVKDNPWHLVGLLCMSSWTWSTNTPLEDNVYRNGGKICKKKAMSFCKSVGLETGEV